MSVPFVVPDTIPGVVPPVDPLRVPDTITAQNVDIPEWKYTKSGPLDIFHTKIGISATVSILTFAILAYMNPPFVQESHGDNRIETKKPCVSILYIVSLIVFIFLMVVPLNPSTIGQN